MRHALPAALAAAALIAGCGGDDDKTSSQAAPAAASATDTIRIADFLYEPDPATVKAGSEIAIANADKAPHTITAEGSRSFDSGTILGGKRGSLTFKTAGTFKYFCAFHPTMKGTVTVTR